jgi:hypothetical protein
MVILESLIIESKEGLLNQILEVLPHDRLEDYSFPAYRIELDADLVLYLYQFTENKRQYEPIYENVLPHLHNCTILTNTEVLRKGQLDDDTLQEMAKLPRDIPIIIAAIPDWEYEDILDKDILISGFTLGNSHRLYFCDFSDKDQIKQLLRQIWFEQVSGTSQKGVALLVK